MAERPRRKRALLALAGLALGAHALVLLAIDRPPAVPAAVAGQPIQARWLAQAGATAVGQPPDRFSALPARAGAAAPHRRRAAPAPIAPAGLAAAIPLPAAPIYWPSKDLERQPLPSSAPDSSQLGGIVATGLPIRLRLFIDARGKVEKVDVLNANPGDEEAAARLCEVFAETGFVPGLRGGVEVASVMDIELQLRDLL